MEITKEEMVTVIREDFKEDKYCELLGFLEAEGENEGSIEYGETYAFYITHNGDMAHENIKDMYAIIISDKEEKEKDEREEKLAAQEAAEEDNRWE